jgi:hypothetical protein
MDARAQGVDEAVVVTGRVTMLTATVDLPEDLTVVLRRFAGMEALQAMRSSAGRDGAFRFEPPAPGPDEVYVVQVNYAGVSYFSMPAVPMAGEELVLDVAIAETTTEATSLSIRELQLVLMASPDGLQIAESYMVGNDGDRTYVGSGERGAATTTMILPTAAENVRLLNDPTGERYRLTGARIEDTYPIMPGAVGSELQIVYALPYRTGMALEREMPMAVESVRITVPVRGVTLAGEGLRSLGVSDTAVGPVEEFAMDGLPAGGVLRLVLSGEPWPASSGPADSLGTSGDATPMGQTLVPVQRQREREALLGGLLFAAALVISYMLWAGGAPGPVPAIMQPLVVEAARLDEVSGGAPHDRARRAEIERALRQMMRRSDTAPEVNRPDTDESAMESR